MSSARAKGLAWCREVKAILKERGYKIEGPGFGMVFVDGRTIPMHKDFFSCFDLISYKDGQFMGHQVTDAHNKAAHEHKMEEQGVQGWLWCRNKEGRKVYWRVFYQGMEIPIGKEDA